MVLLTQKSGMCSIQWNVHFFKNTLNTIFGPKIQNFLFKVKFDTGIQWWSSLHLFSTGNTIKSWNLIEIYSNSNMKNSVVMFTLSVFEWKYPFYGKFVSKNQSFLLKLKLESRLIRRWCNFVITVAFANKIVAFCNCHILMT